MSELDFSMESVTERRKRASFGKRSVYDPIINKFLEGDAKLVEIQVQGKKAGYVKTQLSRRIKSRGLDISVESVSDYVYLERA